MESIQSCPICGNQVHSLLARVFNGDQQLNYQVCERCGHAFQSPRMSGAELEAYYARDYRLHLQGTEDPTEEDLLAQAARAETTVRMVKRWLPPPARHLDIGSSSGALLETFGAAYQCAGVGIEPGKSYRAYAHRRGLEIFDALRSLPDPYQGSFDLVTAMHVVEHLSDPVDTLLDVRRRWIVPSGRLLLEVPNLGPHESFERAHLHAFTPTSVADTVERAGFRVCHLKVHGGYRSPILRLYITLLAQPTEVRQMRRYFPFAALRTRLRYRVGHAIRSVFTRLLPDWTWQSPSTAICGDRTALGDQPKSK